MPAQRGAILGEIRFHAGGVAPPVRPRNLAEMGEFRRDDASGADGLAIEIAHFVDHGEAVAAAQVVVEVDVAAEDIGELQRHRIGKVAGVGSGEQRRFDLARRHLPAHFNRRRARRCGESARHGGRSRAGRRCR